MLQAHKIQKSLVNTLRPSTMLVVPLIVAISTCLIFAYAALTGLYLVSAAASGYNTFKSAVGSGNAAHCVSQVLTFVNTTKISFSSVQKPMPRVANTRFQFVPLQVVRALNGTISSWTAARLCSLHGDNSASASNRWLLGRLASGSPGASAAARTEAQEDLTMQAAAKEIAGQDWFFGRYI
jgi:hypothetical protein